MTKEERCGFTEMVEYLVNEDHIWNPEKYVTRNLNGYSFGQESQIRYQYVRGSAFAEGFVGDYKFQLYFSNLQGFQLHFVGKLSTETTFHPYQIVSFQPHDIEPLLSGMRIKVTPV